MTGCWEANGLSRDLPPGVVMQGAYRGHDLAIWRSASGRLAAWNDRCPHRGMRLSHGFVRGETLSCIYHGWVYGTSGGCSRIPAHPDLVPPAAIRADAYACHEADGVIWVAPDGTAAPMPVVSSPAQVPLKPVRSLTVAGPATLSVAGLTGADTLQGTVEVGGQAVVLCLIVQPRTESKTTLHALCAQTANAVAVSRWLEDLRRRFEEGILA